MKRVTELDYRKRIERVINAISAAPAAPHRLDDLARLAHFSPFHFHRIYSAMVGESVAETARRMRLALAAHLLATTDRPVTEVAMEAGYESVQTFSRAFRSLTQVAPRTFRARRMRLSELVVGPRPINHGGTQMKVEIVERRPLNVWAFRHRGPMAEVQKTYNRLWQWQIDHGIAGHTKEAMGICYGDGEGDDDGFRYYAAIEWEEPVKSADGAERHEVPGGKYACYRLLGSYDGIPNAFGQLYGEWLPASGYVPDDRPGIEIYRNNPFDTPENELITDLLIPLKADS
jgi:AraC family transcriptional regulator